MNQQEFEHQVLELWTKTRVPLTRSNLLVHTKVPRQKLDRWLMDMVKERLLELDSDDEGEILWKVRGSARPARGPETLGEINRRSKLSEDVDRLTSGASLALRAAGIATKASASAPAEKDKKSLIASGALSFFFGPLGWLYAAPLKEAVPAILVFAIVCAILPNFLLAYILPMVNIPSAIAGLAYAWSYNREGRRMPLVLKDPPALPPAKG
jgi:hypothetical protein